MKTRQYSLVILGLLLLLTTFTAGCAREETPEVVDKDQPQGTVDVIRLEGGDWGYPSPYAHYPRGPGGFKTALIFDSLLERDENGLIPWLAEEYQVKNNGRQYLFTIRRGVKWHDGKPLTADDVRFTFEYASKYPMVWSQFSGQDIAKVEIVGENQVLISVSSPNAAMLYNLGTTRILPRHIWEKVDNPREFTTAEAVTGCGPYRLTGYSKEHGTYRLSAFADYWGPQPRVKTLEFLPVSEPILAFEKGEIDLATITPDVLPRFANKSEYKIVQSPGFWGYRLLFNLGDNPLLQSREMRQAFAYAINSRDLVEKIARGAGIPGSAGILPPDHVMYNSKVKQYDRNLQKAGELLDKLGYKQRGEDGIRRDTNGNRLTFALAVPDTAVRLAEMLKAQLGHVGIEVTIRSADRNTHDARIQNNDYQLAVHGHEGWGNDANYLYERFGGEQQGGISPSSMGLRGYHNDQLNKLLQQQRLEMDPAKRQKIVYQLQEVLAEEVLEIPLFYTTDYSVYRPSHYDGWMFMYDHHSLSHSKLSYLERN